MVQVELITSAEELEEAFGLSDGPAYLLPSFIWVQIRWQLNDIVIGPYWVRAVQDYHTVTTPTQPLRAYIIG